MGRPVVCSRPHQGAKTPAVFFKVFHISADQWVDSHCHSALAQLKIDLFLQQDFSPGPLADAENSG